MRRIPIAVRSKIVEKVVNVDEGPRPDISLAALTKLRPVFAAKGSVTAGNASQMSDGAGAAILVSEKILKQYNLKPLARVGQRRRRASRKSWSHGHSSSPVSSRTTSTGSNSTRPRRPGPGLHAYPQSRSREGQPARRCDRAGSPARRDRRHPRPDARQRHSTRSEDKAWHGLDVHRNGNGIRCDLRAGLRNRNRLERRRAVQDRSEGKCRRTVGHELAKVSAMAVSTWPSNASSAARGRPRTQLRMRMTTGEVRSR